MIDNNTGTTCLRWSLRDPRTRAKTFNTAEGNV
jgi:hypothetical protein